MTTSFPKISVVVVVGSAPNRDQIWAAQCSRRGPICPGYEVGAVLVPQKCKMVDIEGKTRH